MSERHIECDTPETTLPEKHIETMCHSISDFIFFNYKKHPTF